MKKTNNKKNTNNKKMVMSVILSVIVLLMVLLVLASYFKDYGKTNIRTNKKEIFTINDLSVNKLKYGDTIETIEKELGKPKKESDSSKGIYSYKILEYKGLKLTLKEDYNDFILVGADITHKKYKIGRNIRVKNKISKVFRKYRVDNSKGAYLYGNYSKKVLYDEENKSNVYFGIRTSKNLLYVNRDSVVSNLPTNIAQLNIVYDHGRIKKISWSYDSE